MSFSFSQQRSGAAAAAGAKTKNQGGDTLSTPKGERDPLLPTGRVGTTTTTTTARRGLTLSGERSSSFDPSSSLYNNDDDDDDDENNDNNNSNNNRGPLSGGLRARRPTSRSPAPTSTSSTTLALEGTSSSNAQMNYNDNREGESSSILNLSPSTIARVSHHHHVHIHSAHSSSRNQQHSSQVTVASGASSSGGGYIDFLSADHDGITGGGGGGGSVLVQPIRSLSSDGSVSTSATPGPPRQNNKVRVFFQNRSRSATPSSSTQPQQLQQQQPQQLQLQLPQPPSSSFDPSSTTTTTLQPESQLQQQQQRYPPPLPPSTQQHHHHHRAPSPDAKTHEGPRSVESGSQGAQPPLLEIPEEIYAIRKAALKVLKPLTKTWIVISVGFSLTVLFGMARWTRLLPTVPYWVVLLPCWLSHVGLLWLHALSARALSIFIAEANESRQRPDSRDHLNRTEYLPLLQRSLKFGLKTGVLSFFVFLFEILIFIRLAHGSISLTAALVPLWLLVVGGIFDGLVCKTQHFLRVLCWMLSFAAMTLLVLKVDYGHDEIRWRIVVCPVVAVLTVASSCLIYIVYGHQIGYYRLTEAQLTAGNLYALAALICIILVVMIEEVIPLSRPVEVETKLFVVVLAPLIVCLTGMGAWVVSRDEFSRLLLYGGQAAVHPKKLRWMPRDGWTCVQGKGVTVIPMFGEVTFQPLARKGRLSSSSSPRAIELCRCCSGHGCCYPCEEVDEEEATPSHPAAYHPYLDSALSGTRGTRNPNSYNPLRGL